jgi:hypothetical protein
VHPHSQSVVTPHGSSELQFTTSVAHYIVDDDSDHVLMRMTIPGHLVKRKSKTKTTVSWRLDLLKDKQIADTYRAQIKDPATW